MTDISNTVAIPSGVNREETPRFEDRFSVPSPVVSSGDVPKFEDRFAVPDPTQPPAPVLSRDPLMREAQDALTDRSSVGRVLDAFGQGAKDGWGAGDIGLSEASSVALRDMGLFPSVKEGFLLPVKAFNEALIRPAAYVMDAFFRSLGAVNVGVAGAIGETAEVTGLAEAVGLPGKKLARDLAALTEVTGIAFGAAPLRRPRGPRHQRVDLDDAGTKAGATFGDDAPGATQPIKSAAADPAAPKVTTAPTPETATIDKAGNINLDRIAAPEDVKNIIRETAVNNDEFIEARRGVVSFEEMDELAAALGMTPEQLATRKIGEAFNAEEVTAAREMLIQSAHNVRDKAIAASKGADADVAAFEEAQLLHVTIQEQVAGLTAEAGRALGAFRKTAQASREAEAAVDLVMDAVKKGDLQDIAKKLSELDTPAKVSRYLMEARSATSGEMFIEAWINALLSGPTTHVTNILSNGSIALLAIPETVIAAAVSKGRSVVKKVPDAERVYFREASARAFGLVQGAKDGVVAGWRAYKTEIGSGYDATKIETPRQRSIPSVELKIAGMTFEVGGKQVRIPGRLLLAGDEFFKSVAYRQELNAQAFRKAAAEWNGPTSGPAFSARVAENLANPTAAMKKAASTNAEYQTFTKPLGKTGRSVQAFFNGHPALKVIVPFIRTPVNIIKYAGERTSLSVFSKEVRAVMGGSKGEAAAAQQYSRLLMGSAISTATIAFVAEGKITGAGPTDTAERAVLYGSGWQPYSILVGDVYYSYARMEPFATIMGIAADLYEAKGALSDREFDEVAAELVGAIAKSLVSKTWLQGPADLMEVFSDPDRYGDRYVRKLLGTVVPTGIAQTARVMDPMLRDARTFLDTIKSRTPVISESVLPRRDITGEPVELGGALGPDILSPIYESRLTNDPVFRELLDLEVFPGQPKRQIRGVELTDEQYDTLQEVSGKYFRTLVTQQINQPGWASIPHFARVEIVTKMLDVSRKAGRVYVTMLNPNIIEEQAASRVEQVNDALVE